MDESFETSARVPCCVPIRAQPNAAAEHSSFALDLLRCGGELLGNSTRFKNKLQTMGFATKQTTKEVTAPPRLPGGSNSFISFDDLVPWDVPVPVPAPAPPAPAYPHVLAPAMKFLADVKADGTYRSLLLKFLADVKAAGKYSQLLPLLQDFTEYGLHPGLITSAEKLFEDHPDLLVAFNTILAGEYQ